MKRFAVLRLAAAPDQPTFGHLVDEEQRVVCCTLELPWRDNTHGISCIPVGEYPAHRFLSPKRGYEVFMLDGVPDRTAIELHIGNTLVDTDGCLLLGSAFGTINGQHGITESGDAFRAFMALLAGESNFVLTVADAVTGFIGEDGG